MPRRQVVYGLSDEWANNQNMWWWLLSLSALTRCIRPYRSAASEIVSFLFKGSGPSRFPNDNRNCIWIYIILVEFRWISSSGGVAASPEAMQKSFFFVPNEGKVIFQDKKKNNHQNGHGRSIAPSPFIVSNRLSFPDINRVTTSRTSSNILILLTLYGRHFLERHFSLSRPHPLHR